MGGEYFSSSKTKSLLPEKGPEVVVVEASAGSGKTYCLANRFIELVLNNTSSVKEILAITFTNQATYEMKARILELLKEIALDNKNKAQDNAQQILDYIIHNYHFFQVQTIDSFINLLLCGCAYRLGVSANFKIKETFEEALTYSLDELIDRACEDKMIYRLFSRFLKQYLYIENKGGWLPRRQILNVLSGLFYHFTIYPGRYRKFKTKVNIIQEKKRIIKLLKSLKDKLPQGVNKTFKNTLESFLERRDIFDIGDFASKKLFLQDKLPLNKGESCPKTVDNLWRKLKERVRKLAEEEALSIFNCYIDLFDLVYKTLREYCSQEDLLFLNELNQQAKCLIEEHNLGLPEIYWRLSSRFNHYLIDEFQDTSLLQWHNLEMMVEDCLSQGGSLFYVGDKKQAIYRFRGGDVFLFNEVKKKFHHFNVKESFIKVNYRSSKEIVEFNNAVFSPDNLRRFLKDFSFREEFTEDDIEEVVSIFYGSRQNYNKKRGGYVEVKKIEYQNSEDRDEKIKDELLSLLDSLRKRFSWKDIAILCRSNDEVEMSGGWLMENNICVESEKTLNIKNNPLIKEIISFLKFLNSPIDNLSFASFILGDIFLKVSGLRSQVIENFLFSLSDNLKDSFYIYRKFRKIYPRLWEDYIESFFKTVGFMNLYELVVRMLERLKVLDNFPHQQAFFMHLLELIKLEEEEHPTLKEFLDYFEQEDNEKFHINAATQEAVKIMSIHKAKGLQFPVVILPFLDLKVQVAGSQLKRGRSPYVVEVDKGKLSLLRLDSKYAKLSALIREKFREEYKKSFIDELNVIYVGVSRPQEELYIFIPCLKGKSERSVSLLIPSNYWKRGEKSFVSKEKVSLKTGNLISLKSSPFKDWRKFLKEELGELELIKKRKELLRGEVFHTILSFIGRVEWRRKEAILNEAIKKASPSFPAIEDFSPFKSKIEALLEAEEIKEFFYLDEGDVFTEKEIVDTEGQTFRLDRLIVKDREVIIVDFKSSSQGKDRYYSQIKEYIKIVRNIYPQKRISAFLVYIDEVKCERVN